MKKTLERIQRKAKIWRYTHELNLVGSEEMAGEMMYEIETILDEAGFHD
jgi:hypothetical protein